MIRRPASPRMTRDLWARLEPLVDAVIELPASQRAAYIDAVVLRDAELGPELKLLFDCQATVDSLLSAGAAERFSLLFEGDGPRYFADDLHQRLDASLGAAYAFEHELRGGGIARVFVARDLRDGRRVVLKVLQPEFAMGISAERFEREIRVSASLHHANIVPLLMAGRLGELSYYIMPLVDGSTLRERLARAGALPIGDAVAVLRDVARALAHAHQCGVVHRDIKPANIILAKAGAVVIDFGIAKAFDDARDHRESSMRTKTGVLLGTPAYMSPEQCRADRSIDHRADIYAMGVVAYEMLTGNAPFAGRPSQQTIAAHVSETPAPVDRERAEIPPALATLVMRCLGKRAADRPQTATELTDALEAIVSSSDPRSSGRPLGC